MFALKPLSREGLPGALAKAERYRLLNEPSEAESICLDVLAIEPDHPGALVLLLLALTDQFDEQLANNVARAQEVMARLASDYERAYYAAIIDERRAKTHLRRGGPGASGQAFLLLRTAMSGYERAEAVRPAGIDDPMLRWNACARMLMRHPELEPTPEERYEPYLE